MPPFREPPRHQFERVANFRDLGGHTTRDGRSLRPGRLYRSAHLAHASDPDVELLSSLGLRRVFDFRTLSDIEIDGSDRLPPDAQHVRLPMPDPAAGDDIRSMLNDGDPDAVERLFGGGRAHDLMVRSAAGLVRERRAPYAAFLEHLAEPQAFPALFHCSAGKDRAGWAASVVLLAMGVEEEQIVEQYLLSNREVERIRERLRTAESPDWAELLQPLLEVRTDYIEASLSAVREDWGDFDRYLHEGLGISEIQREQLRKNFLD